MSKKPLFKTDFGEVAHVTDPETLFRDLRGRSPEIRHLWSHQADVLRAYHKQFQNAKHVAIELPTGAGKTLVGLLIAEYRRQSSGERVAYLCPTRQLARQVGAHASKYGIKAHVFVGKQRDYPPGDFSEFQSSSALAITTYSSVFNSNPRISDAQSLILDDAHASENYTASMWSVEIQRREHEGLYLSLVDLFKGGISASFYDDITRQISDNRPKTDSVELVLGTHVRERLSAIRELLDQHLPLKTPASYAWELVKEHMSACGIFASWDAILIRPFIPPTLTHPPFARANQRVYMSATLGAGGELERITGVHRIERLPVPPGWDTRGSGRRLFLVPQVALRDDEASDVVLAAIRTSERSLILAPTNSGVENLRSSLAELGLTALGAAEIEDSIEPFTAKTAVVLVLSRYDGLDLPDDACRLLVIDGMPKGSSLQEEFLWSRIAAHSLLRDRVLTRFSQGVGRCTRSDNDYAIVFVIGRPLVDFILKHDNRRLLHPELQAELEFGIDNCKDKKPEEFKVLQEAFLAHGDQWQDAEMAIVGLREGKQRYPDPVSDRLSSVVSDEVSFIYSKWTGDYKAALTCARKVADLLEGDETKGYRGWWYYLAADTAIAFCETSGDEQLLDVANDLLRRAGRCCPIISWFAHVARTTSSKSEPAEADELAAIAVENIRARLTEWGLVGRRFEDEVNQTAKHLESTEHRQFHRGLKTLGEMLGFRSELTDNTGDPDCIWSIGSELYVVHEAKSDHTPGDPIGVNDIRQAQSHENWIRGNRPCTDSTQILPIIISPRTTVDSSAVVHAQTLCHLTPELIQRVCQSIANLLRGVRAIAPGLSDEQVLERLHTEISAAKLTPRDILEMFAVTRVREMKSV